MKFNPSKKKDTDFNNGEQLRPRVDGVPAQLVNNLVESQLYSQQQAENANSKASEANSNAKNAVNNSQNAQSTANTAVSTANKAKKDAENVLQRANLGEFNGKDGANGKDAVLSNEYGTSTTEGYSQDYINKLEPAVEQFIQVGTEKNMNLPTNELKIGGIFFKMRNWSFGVKFGFMYSPNRCYVKADNKNILNAIIPETTIINGNTYPVTVIREFQDCTKLTKIVLPNSITNIFEGAFLGCVGLKSIILSNKLTYIDNQAFKNCKMLDGIVLPFGITSIGSEAFAGCENLTSIAIPYGISTINTQTFKSCTNLKNIDIPSSVNYIGIGAFSGCSSLASITIPNNVTNLPDIVFSDCSELTSINIPQNVTNIGISALSGCNKLKTITFNGTVDQWNSINKGSNWNANTLATFVQCANGRVDL